MYTIHYTLYTIHCTLYTIHYTYTLNTIHYTLYTIHYTLYAIHYTLYTIHYSLYTIRELHTLCINEVGAPGEVGEHWQGAWPVSGHRSGRVHPRGERYYDKSYEYGIDTYVKYSKMIM
jgi:hypothetical protein